MSKREQQKYDKQQQLLQEYAECSEYGRYLSITMLHPIIHYRIFISKKTNWSMKGFNIQDIDNFFVK